MPRFEVRSSRAFYLQRSPHAHDCAARADSRRAVRDQPSRATSVPRRARCRRWVCRGWCWWRRSAFRIRMLTRSRRALSQVLDAVRVERTLDAALAGTVLAIGFSARPREFAGSGARGARRRGGSTALRCKTARSRWYSAARCRVCRTPSSRAARSWRPFRRARISLRSISPPPSRSPPTKSTVAAKGGEVWRAPRFEPATQDEIERLFDARREGPGRTRFPATGPPEATPAAAAPIVRAGAAGKGGGQHPARHPGSHRGAHFAPGQYLSESVGYGTIGRCSTDSRRHRRRLRARPGGALALGSADLLPGFARAGVASVR